MAYTSTSALSNLVQTAYDTSVRAALRSTPLFRAIADTRPTSQSMPGDSVVFNIRKKISVAEAGTTTPLNEITDPEAIAIKNTTPVTVTLNQYGAVVLVTDLLEQFELSGSINTAAVDDVAYLQAETVDALVSAVLDSGDNNIVEQADGDIEIVENADLGSAVVTKSISAKDIRYAVAKLRSASVAPVDGVNYVAYIHPNVATDFRTESAAAAWLAPHEYVDVANLYAGEIGTFNGVRFIETPRVPVSDAGVYTTFIVGKEALAEAVADEFHVVLNGTVVDPLDRKMAIGFKGTAGWSIFRPEALWTVKSISTIV